MKRSVAEFGGPFHPPIHRLNRQEPKHVSCRRRARGGQFCVKRLPYSTINRRRNPNLTFSQYKKGAMEVESSRKGEIDAGGCNMQLKRFVFARNDAFVSVRLSFSLVCRARCCLRARVFDVGGSATQQKNKRIEVTLNALLSTLGGPLLVSQLAFTPYSSA